MKIKNYGAGLLLIGVLFGNKVLAQSTITELLKTKPAAPDKNSSHILINYKHSFIRSYELTMANGVRVVVRADEGRKDVLMTATRTGGASIVDDNDFESALHAGAIIGNSGLANYTGLEVNKFFQQKNITLTPDIDEKYSTLKGSCLSNDFETFLQAIYLYFTEPRKDKAYFNTYIKRLEVSAAVHNKNPYSVFQDTVSALATTDKNRVNTLSTAKIEKINLDKAYEIFRKCFGNAHGYTFVFTGNFKADDMNYPKGIIPLLDQYLGSLPSADTTTIIDRNTEIPQGKIYKKVYYGHAPLAAVQLIYSGNYQHVDSVNLQLKVLSYLLEKNLDTLKAFSGVNKALVKLTLNKFPKESYSINIAFKCLPLQVEKMVAIVHETIAGLQHGIKPEEIKQYVALRKRELKVQTFDYAFWRDYLVLQFMNGDDPYEVVHYPYNFYKADEHTVQQAANQFLTSTNYIQAVLLPAKRK
jgi:Peptidase M16 inactive domain